MENLWQSTHTKKHSVSIFLSWYCLENGKCHSAVVPRGVGDQATILVLPSPPIVLWRWSGGHEQCHQHGLLCNSLYLGEYSINKLMNCQQIWDNLHQLCQSCEINYFDTMMVGTSPLGTIHNCQHWNKFTKHSLLGGGGFQWDKTVIPYIFIILTNVLWV